MVLYYGVLLLVGGEIPGLELDMPFSLDTVPGGEVVIWVVDPDPTWEEVVQGLKAAEQAMKDAGIPVAAYSLALRLPRGENGEYMGDGLGVHGLPAEKLDEENLPKFLEEYQRKREEDWQKENEK